MANNLVKKDDVIINTLKEMIGPDEKVQKVSRRTIIKTDIGVHTAWEVYKPNGNKALFTSTKKN